MRGTTAIPFYRADIQDKPGLTKILNYLAYFGFGLRTAPNVMNEFQLILFEHSLPCFLSFPL